jgi:carbamate kinase
MRSLIVALGGNALQPPGESPDFAAMSRRVDACARSLAHLAAEDVRLVITHGNGPQVGDLLAQSEEARGKALRPPLDVLVAETQAQIGYLLQQALANEFARLLRPGNVATVVTQVVVDPADPAFHRPTKPVGPLIKSDTEAMLRRARGWQLVQDPRGGWRRVVPSPRPLEVIEVPAIRALLSAGLVVIAAGGGGVPVVRENGRLVGVEAVIDKDFTSAILARDLAAEQLVFATDVDAVALDYGKPGQRSVPRMTVAEAREYLGEGQFPEGSMGPKVEAAILFVSAGGREALITSVAALGHAIGGETGTRIVP